MAPGPETRPSLIARLRDGGGAGTAAAEAWDEFVAIYRPAIVGMAVLKGLQRADAEDVAQQVLVSVSKHVGGWEHDPERAKFRTWLQTLVRNATLNALSRRPKDQAQGGTTALVALEQYEGDREADSALFDAQWRREALRWAADAVCNEFETATWDAFWLTAVEGMPPAEAAAKTGKTIGAVYVARTRVMQRIREKVSELEDEG